MICFSFIFSSIHLKEIKWLDLLSEWKAEAESGQEGVQSQEGLRTAEAVSWVQVVKAWRILDFEFNVWSSFSYQNLAHFPEHQWELLRGSVEVEFLLWLFWSRLGLTLASPYVSLSAWWSCGRILLPHQRPVFDSWPCRSISATELQVLTL